MVATPSMLYLEGSSVRWREISVLRCLMSWGLRRISMSVQIVVGTTVAHVLWMVSACHCFVQHRIYVPVHQVKNFCTPRIKIHVWYLGQNIVSFLDELRSPMLVPIRILLSKSRKLRSTMVRPQPLSNAYTQPVARFVVRG